MDTAFCNPLPNPAVILFHTLFKNSVFVNLWKFPKNSVLNIGCTWEPPQTNWVSTFCGLGWGASIFHITPGDSDLWPGLTPTGTKEPRSTCVTESSRLKSCLNSSVLKISFLPCSCRGRLLLPVGVLRPGGCWMQTMEAWAASRQLRPYWAGAYTPNFLTSVEQFWEVLGEYTSKMDSLDYITASDSAMENWKSKWYLFLWQQLI